MVLRIEGVPITQDFEFQLDQDAVPIRDSTTVRAVASAIVKQGHHFVAAVWKGPPDEPAEFSVTFHRFKTPEQLRVDHPELLRVVMKHTRPEAFTLIGRFLISFPDDKGTQVFGIYSVVKAELRRDPAHGAIIKQDFLVWEPSSGAPPIYYSGLGGKGDPLHLHITQLCERFGPSHFGCERTRKGGWNCGDHWVNADEIGSRLPVEPEFRVEAEKALNQARAEIGRL